MGSKLQATLSHAFSTPANGYLELARSAWPALACPEVDPIFALFFEANGLAAAGRSPYDTLVPLLIEQWTDWLMGHLTGTTKQRRSQAEAAIALIDGLLPLRQLAGPPAAKRAATILGIIP